jgi:hypothetical protein
MLHRTAIAHVMLDAVRRLDADVLNAPPALH